MKKVLGWLGVFALLLNLVPGLLQTAHAAFNYSIAGLVADTDPLDESNWTKGNLCQGGGGCYTEGDNVPSRLTITGLTSGTPYSLIIQHDYKDSDNHVGYENFNRISPVRPDVNASGVSITFLNEEPDSSDIVRNYTLAFTATGSSATIYWNSLLGVDAADWNGASLHFRLDEGIGGENVGNQDVPIPVGQLLFLPSITLTKTIDNGTAAPDLWDFNVSPSINGTSTYNIPDGQSSITINNVPGGTYTITEAAGASGYQFISGDGTNCTFSGATATATVAEGDPATDATCNFHNTESIGGIRVHKDVVGPNGEALTDTSANFDIYLDGGNVQSLTDGGSYIYSNVSVGPHTISEPSLPSGYTLYSMTPDSDGSTPGAQVSVTFGQTIDVYVTNRQQSSTVIIHKDVLSPSGADVNDDHTFEVSLGSDTENVSESTDATYVVNSGSYTLTETIDPDYDLVSITPDDNDQISGAQLTVAPGETKHIFVVNKQKQSRIIVFKDVIAPNGSDVTDDHSFTAQLNGGDDKTISESTFATYYVDPFTSNTIGELDDPAYTEEGCFLPSGADATDFQLASNETINVVCLNSQIASVVRIHKDVRLSNGTDIDDNTTFTVTDGTTPKDLSELTIAEYILPPGTYTFTEESLANYFINSISPDNNSDPTDGTTVTLASGETVDIYIVNYREIGEIEIIKQVEPPDESQWDFAISGPASYSANDLGDGQSSGNITALTGTYTITETSNTDNVDDYVTTYVCRIGDEEITSGEGREITGLELEADELITCEFTNSLSVGDIVVHKDVVGPNDEDITDTSTNFNIFLDGDDQVSLTDGGSHTYSSVMTGTHTISEPSLPSGYTLAGITPDNDSETPGAQIDVTFGQTTDVYVTNRQQSSTVIIHKDVLSPSGADVNDDHTFEVSLDSDTENISESTDATYTVNSGSFTLTETSDPDYDLVSITPDSDSGTTGAQFSVAPGETKHIFVVNKQKIATIIVHKEVLNPDGEDVSDDHPFTVQLNSGDDKTISESQTAIYNVDPFTSNTISEIADDNYDHLGCFQTDEQGVPNTEAPSTNLKLASNQVMNVVCFNQQRSGIVRIHKDVLLANGTDIEDNTTFTVSDGTTAKNFSELTIAEYILPPGVYTFTEFDLANYFLNSIDPDDNSDPNDGTTLTLSSGQEVDITFFNYREIGEIEITKQVEPADESQWDFAITGPASYSVNDLSDNESSGNITALTGTYDITETSDTDTAGDYDTTYICRIGEEVVAEGSGKVITGLDLESDETINCEFTNTLRRGSITVEKYNDENANGERDEGEETLSGWEFDLSGTKQTTDENGLTTFSELLPANYNLNETLKEGWEQTGNSCENPITLEPGGEIFCQVGNHFAQPTLVIEKSNNRETIPSQIGDVVTYSLIVTAEDNIIDDVKVNDTLPADFSYILGSYTVTSSIRGDITSLVAEETYAENIATWILGKMAKDEVITINYNAIIGLSTPAGIHLDNAWSSGFTLLSDNIFASAGPIGFLDASFVGTSVQVAKTTVPNVFQVVTRDQTVVLAAASLAKTGPSQWPAVFISFVITALLYLAARFKSKIGLVLGGLLIVLALTTAPAPTRAADSDINLRVNSVVSPTNDSTVNVGYVVNYRLNSNDINVVCLKKGPSDISFTSFQNSTYNVYGSGSCNVPTLTTSGTYQIKVTAAVGSDDTESTITFDYIAPGPGTPINYSKTPGTCNNTISFATASDSGKTVGVEVYRSDSTTITTSSANLVEDIAVDSSTAVNRTYTSPDCSKTFYYAIRAYDAGKNYSSMVGDEAVNIINVQSVSGATGTATSTAATGGATSGAAATGTTAPSAATPSGTTGQPSLTNPTTTAGEVAGATTEDKNGNVKGTETAAKKNYNYIYYIGGAIVLIGLYLLARKYYFAPKDQN